jgi:hypothetical protein
MDMPDPRVNCVTGAATMVVEFHESDWRKVVGKHFANSKEPWIDTIPTNIMQALVSGGGIVDEHAQESGLALATIREQVKACLKRPLVILYSCIGEQIHGQGHRWVLLFPSGAVSIAWVEKNKARLKTCYFTGSVGVRSKEGRWRHALRQQVQEYATYDKSTGKYVYPDPKMRREVSVAGTAAELRYSIQFARPEWWGFVSTEPGEPWQQPMWNWHLQESAIRGTSLDLNQSSKEMPS